MKSIPLKAILREMKRRGIRFAMTEYERNKDWKEGKARTAAWNAYIRYNWFMSSDTEAIKVLQNSDSWHQVPDYNMAKKITKLLKDLDRHNKGTNELLKKYNEKWK